MLIVVFGGRRKAATLELPEGLRLEDLRQDGMLDVLTTERQRLGYAWAHIFDRGLAIGKLGEPLARL